MAQRSVPQPRDLLPAPGIRSPLEGDDGSGAGGSGSGKAAKRSKVTAVACVPCQKRKSKCDGRRPICSSCQQKGRTDCVYDSQSDLRRTSALKQRIDSLQAEVNDLRDILLTLCEAHVSGQSATALTLIHNNFSDGDFSRTNEVAQVFRNSTNLNQFRNQGQVAPMPLPYPQMSHAFTPQGIPQPYRPQYGGGMEHDTGDVAPMTDGHSDWSAGGSQDVDAESHVQDHRGNYPY